MAKTQEELTQLKNEYESLATKLQELTEDELKLIVGGDEIASNLCPNNRSKVSGGCPVNCPDYHFQKKCTMKSIYCSYFKSTAFLGGSSN